MSAGPEDIAVAIARLGAGGVVAFPTETVYGLGADALDESAVRRVFALKGRPATNPLIVHVSGVEMAREAASTWPGTADALAREFWPGPLTIVLPRHPRIPAIVAAGGPSVAIRCPCHPLTLALIEAFGRPIVGPSANPSGMISPTRAEHVRSAFSESDVLVLDGGPCVGGIESTVVTLMGEPTVLRRGMISAEQIARVVGTAVTTSAGSHASDRVPASSPGMMSRHYSPRTPARLFDRRDWPSCRSGSDRVVVISFAGLRIAPPDAAIVMPEAAREYAAGLYAALRDADAMGAAEILIERPSGSEPMWSAILDRLTRATHRD